MQAPGGLDASGLQNLLPLRKQMPTCCGDKGGARLVELLRRAGESFGEMVRGGSG